MFNAMSPGKQRIVRLFDRSQTARPFDVGNPCLLYKTEFNGSNVNLVLFSGKLISYVRLDPGSMFASVAMIYWDNNSLMLTTSGPLSSLSFATNCFEADKFSLREEEGRRFVELQPSPRPSLFTTALSKGFRSRRPLIIARSLSAWLRHAQWPETIRYIKVDQDVCMSQGASRRDGDEDMKAQSHA
ncbi:hypothetical protein VNO77_03256 [Canavalia gladiata]|uniref:Uncharacterized protein n=1 Tax=Canavalia gladiata TaxID=3824 RepID=A0AAN9N020_CANGL